MIEAIPHLQPFNYLLADPRRILGVEAYPGRIRRIQPVDGVLAMTNHYRHPDLRPLQRGRNLSHSQTRLAALEHLPASDIDPWSATLARLRDHDSKVCGHQGGHTTLWSMAADLTARRVVYAPGPPCQVEPHEVEWP